MERISVIGSVRSGCGAEVGERNGAWRLHRGVRWTVAVKAASLRRRSERPAGPVVKGEQSALVAAADADAAAAAGAAAINPAAAGGGRILLSCCAAASQAEHAAAWQ